MEDGVTVFLIVMGFAICLGLGFIAGKDYTHTEWRADAIERCSKIQTKEWCQGRAVLEKW